MYAKNPAGLQSNFPSILGTPLTLLWRPPISWASKAGVGNTLVCKPVSAAQVLDLKNLFGHLK